jgi:hypothetical protein
MFSSLSTRTLALVAVSAALVLIYVLWRLVVMIINALYDKAPKARVFLPVLLLALALLLACGCPGPSGPTAPFQPVPRDAWDGVPHWPRVPEYVEREREDWW